LSYKKLTEPKYYGSTNNTYEHLTEISGAYEDSNKEDDELELKKSKTLVMMGPFVSFPWRCHVSNVCYQWKFIFGYSFMASYSFIVC